MRAASPTSTTQPRHEQAVAEMWQRLVAAGDIYEAEYDGMYCVGCEEAKTEDDVIVEGDQKLCPIHRTPVERIKEKNYFFNLPRYAQKLLRWYAEESDGRPPVQPISRLNEVREFVKGGLRPLSASRAAVKWGIPVPGDAQQTIYVWIDALINYVTGLGGPEAVKRSEGNGAFWPVSHHLIGKDLLRFHAVYWPAMLWSAGLEPPKQIFCQCQPPASIRTSSPTSWASIRCVTSSCANTRWAATATSPMRLSFSATNPTSETTSAIS
jgi:methionyl-tRNA synthetase